MAELSDKEITEACARAMGLRWIGYHATRAFREQENWAEWPDGTKSIYNPLHDDAQAMALVKNLRVELWWDGDDCIAERTQERIAVRNRDPLRAICLCAASVQIEKEKNT